MSNLIYLANARLPTEKAHGLQIVQMCEAFGQAGYRVSLVVPARRNQPRFQGKDVADFYGVAPLFDVIRLWTFEPGGGKITRWVYRTQAVTFFASVLAWLASQPLDSTLYSRDPFLLWLIGLIYPRRRLAFEAHTASRTRFGRSVTRVVIRRAALTVAVTRHLAVQLEALAGRPVGIEHDGIRAGRFAAMPSRSQACRKLGLPPGAFVACYVGQLATMGMDKGLGTVIEAFARCRADRPEWHGLLLIVGGPDQAVAALRESWIGRGLPPEDFHAAGQVPPADVPATLAASDVCLMPQPWTEFFAYFTSPLKLFEYMAAGRPILASDLPSFREVLADGENALFVPPSDPRAMAAALLRLSGDPALRKRIGQRNRRDVQRYTWQARAGRIRAALEATYPAASS